MRKYCYELSEHRPYKCCECGRTMYEPRPHICNGQYRKHKLNFLKKIMGKIESQNKQIKAWLESGKSITPMDALNIFGSFRLGARIFDLKNNYGMNIKTEMIEVNGKRFARYYLEKDEDRILERTCNIF